MYVVHTVAVDDERCFVFRSEVCFVTNVFPEHMHSQVARVQREGVLYIGKGSSNILGGHNVIDIIHF